MKALSLFGFLALASLSACATDGDNEGSGGDPRPLDDQYPARLTLSDSGEFYVNAHISISPTASGAPTEGARVVLRATGTNFSKDPTTEAFREGRPDMDTGFGIECSKEQCGALGRGEQVAFSGVGVRYGVPGRELIRSVTTAQMTTNPDHTVTLVIHLAPGFTPLDPTMPPNDPNLGTAETMTVHGQMPILCSTPGALADDPSFTTSFCRGALQEYGLDPIREAQL